MSFKKLLIANRGEIAIRIARAAADAGIATVAIHPADDALSLHVRVADEAVEIPGRGARAYLDIDAVVKAAKSAGCDAVHPGYGFLSENAGFREGLRRRGHRLRRAEAGRAGTVRRQGRGAAAGKALRRADHRRHQRPIEARGDHGVLRLARQQRRDRDQGDGRRRRPRHARRARRHRELEEAYARCRSEAKAAFGFDGVYVERLIRQARHIEVQIIGDSHGAISSSLGARMHHPAPASEADRGGAEPVAERAAARPHHRGGEAARDGGLLRQSRHLRVPGRRHGRGQLRLHRGQSAAPGRAHRDGRGARARSRARPARDRRQAARWPRSVLRRARSPKPRGYAMQLRVNMETLDADGATHPTGGVLAVFEPPSGPGVRVDSFGYAGYKTSRGHSTRCSRRSSCIRRAKPGTTSSRKAVARFARIPDRRRRHQHRASFRRVLAHPDFRTNRIATDFIDRNIGKARRGSGWCGQARCYFAATERAGATAPRLTSRKPCPEGAVMVAAPMQGTIVTIQVKRRRDRCAPASSSP